MRYELYPLVSAEIPDFDLIAALNKGYYQALSGRESCQTLICLYWKLPPDEIINEAKIRNIPSFSRFLEAAASLTGRW